MEISYWNYILSHARFYDKCCNIELYNGLKKFSNRKTTSYLSFRIVIVFERDGSIFLWNLKQQQKNKKCKQATENFSVACLRTRCFRWFDLIFLKFPKSIWHSALFSKNRSWTYNISFLLDRVLQFYNNF